jgi:hypothetical protein
MRRSAVDIVVQFSGDAAGDDKTNHFPIAILYLSFVIAP